MCLGTFTSQASPASSATLALPRGQRWGIRETDPPPAALLAALLGGSHRSRHSILVALGLSGELWEWRYDDSVMLFLPFSDG